MIQYRVGGLLNQEDVGIIVHCCKTLGKMGAGIAGQIAKQYPETYIAFRKDYVDGNAKCGNLLMHECRDKLFVHTYGQDTIYPRGVCHVKYDEFKQGLQIVAHYAKSKGLTVGVPYKMASDLAGGDWSVVLPILEEVFIDVNCIICKLF